MKKTYPFLPLFTQFVKDCESGKRLKKNGERITKSSVKSYVYVLNNLSKFCEETGFDLRICDVQKLNSREMVSEKNYWKKFYKNFTGYLYKKGCFDNYVGSSIKTIRVFFNYLQSDKNIMVGDFHKNFYVRKEEIDILVLSPEQLKFLIHDVDFDASLTENQRRIKEIFVFGCTTGLRYSDIFMLTSKNFELNGDDWYLKLKSKKTKTFTSVKLPPYAVAIYLKYKPKHSKQAVFGKISLFNFNRMLKLIGEKANFVSEVSISREQQGKTKHLQARDKKNRFCDKMSSHMMRRTAITTLLILGMPEHLVRKVSGHSNASSSFNRYVHYAQVYIDQEIDKVYNKLSEY
ncbi:tyrosine-type recombinase/integrase [Flavobacterium capsici]|uniref:Tyrosine-type recombinase/integrase n=1 Tax=Flavobacterium capsici TaxID=3075618 RepID=A0AA96J9T1_9FLAO|nr:MULTISPECIES: tyrosine-type recombinase/integrase [unclassified Flavobacterium]WNM19475.1 tyrosine-type recombinase/integrase [Flavobacterium sp. PMR2A8]WNM20864.1 tyrosine-type recombinase/integrase [Flavobacterium sp. PMTSA4]